MTRPSTPSVICYVAALTLAFVLTWEAGTRTDRVSNTSRASSGPPNLANPTVKGISNRKSIDIAESYGKLPLAFEANHGQADRRVRFLARGNGYTLFLTRKEAVLALSTKRREVQDRAVPRASRLSPGAFEDVARTNPPSLEYVRMRLVGSNPNASVSGMEELPGKSNYFIGNDKSKWHTNIPTYARVKYREAYSGIDLVYYGNTDKLEYDFIVAPGADPKAIRLGLDASEKAEVDSQGALVLETINGHVRFEAPMAYQVVGGQRKKINARYSLPAAHTVKFELGPFDRSKSLVIDPVLVYSTYFALDGAFGISVDSNGNAYITGGSPGAQGKQNDVFVAKLNSSGSGILYSTFFGGSGNEAGFSIAVDSKFSVYVTGATTSTDFPLQNAFQTVNKGGANNVDGFVTKLDASGSNLVYSTYLGGSGDDEMDGGGIAVDSLGSAYVLGSTLSSDLPTKNAFQSTKNGDECVFVTKFGTEGTSLTYLTYLCGGGTSTTFPGGIVVDNSGNAYVTGSSGGVIPTLHGFQVQAPTGSRSYAYMTEFNSVGNALVYSTILAGSNIDGGHGIAIDGSGNIYVTGFSESTDFPTRGAFQSKLAGATDAFVAKLNPSQSGDASLVYSTYLGGSQFENSGGTSVGGGAIAVDALGDAWVTGSTFSNDFPTKNPFQAACSSCSVTGGAILMDAFVSELDPSGSTLLYSTFLGGGNDENFTNQCLIVSCLSLAYPGGAIAVDQFGDAYVAGLTSSGNFPTTPNAYRGTNNSRVAFASKFAILSVAPSGVNFGNQLVGTSSPTQAVTLTNTGSTAIAISGEAISGANPSDFSQTNTCAGSLGGGASCTVSLTFTPAVAGPLAGTFGFSRNGLQSPQAIPLTGNGTDFSLGPASGAPTSATFTAGQSATLNLQVNPASGFTGAVTLACIGAPAQSTCAPSASSVNVSGASAVPFSVTITTTARGILPPTSFRRLGPNTPHLPLPLAVLATLCAVMVALRAFGRLRSTPLRTWATSVIFLACTAVTFVTVSGCGGGTPPPTPSGTPAGTYNLTVTGTSQGQNRTVTLVLTVN